MPPKASMPPPQTSTRASAPPPPPQVKASTATLVESDGVIVSPRKVVIYGTGGIGKTELVTLVTQLGMKMRILDIDEGSQEHNVPRVSGFTDWQSVRDYLNDHSKWEGYDLVDIDGLVPLEELAVKHVVANVPHEKGKLITCLSDYGFNKGLEHVYNLFLTLLADLDSHVRAGRHVVMVCNECCTPVPNPGGDDYLRFEPRLQSPKSGKSSIRHKVLEWCSDMWYLGYDMMVEDGKAVGSGSRTIYPQQQPTFLAKSRRLNNPVEYKRGNPFIWKQLFGVK